MTSNFAALSSTVEVNDALQPEDGGRGPPHGREEKKWSRMQVSLRETILLANVDSHGWCVVTTNSSSLHQHVV